MRVQGDTQGYKADIRVQGDTKEYKGDIRVQGDTKEYKLGIGEQGRHDSTEGQMGLQSAGDIKIVTVEL